MKILNVCISAPYIEGFSYQENILTDYLLGAGIETPIVASSILPSYMISKKIKPGVYDDGEKKVTRLRSFKISSEFIIVFGLFNQLIKEKPDVIFHHNLNCTSMLICTLYRIMYPKTVLLVDNHADYINRNKNKFWQLIYYKMLVGISARFASIYVKKFYGVTPSRCDYLHEVYGISKSKIDFLPIGANVKAADSITKNKFELRNMHDLPINGFLFVSGGKMGTGKGTDKLIKVINEISAKRKNIFLLLFGSFSDKETKKLAEESQYVIVKEWCNNITSLELLKASDVAVWTIHHTTLIEDAISVRTPLLLRKTRTTEHLVEGNGVFLENSDCYELSQKINKLLDGGINPKVEEACIKMRKKLDYNNIVQKILIDVYQ